MKWFPTGLSKLSSAVTGTEADGPDNALRHWEGDLCAAGFFVIDLETSGFQPDKDVVLSLAAGCMNGTDPALDPFQYDIVHVDDITQVPEFIWGLTGLSADLVRGGKPWDGVLRRALRLAGNRVWVAHHARHELSFIQYYARMKWKTRLRPLVVDTAVIAQALLRLPQAPTLEAVCDWLEIPVENRHRADADVQMTALVWRREMALCRRMGLLNVADIVDWAISRASG